MQIDLNINVNIDKYKYNDRDNYTYNIKRYNCKYIIHKYTQTNE